MVTRCKEAANPQLAPLVHNNLLVDWLCLGRELQGRQHGTERQFDDREPVAGGAR